MQRMAGLSQLEEFVAAARGRGSGSIELAAG